MPDCQHDEDYDRPAHYRALPAGRSGDDSRRCLRHGRVVAVSEARRGADGGAAALRPAAAIRQRRRRGAGASHCGGSDPAFVAADESPSAPVPGPRETPTTPTPTAWTTTGTTPPPGTWPTWPPAAHRSEDFRAVCLLHSPRRRQRASPAAACATTTSSSASYDGAHRRQDRLHQGGGPHPWSAAADRGGRRLVAVTINAIRTTGATMKSSWMMPSASLQKGAPDGGADGLRAAGGRRGADILRSAGGRDMYVPRGGVGARQLPHPRAGFSLCAGQGGAGRRNGRSCWTAIRWHPARCGQRKRSRSPRKSAAPSGRNYGMDRMH